MVQLFCVFMWWAVCAFFGCGGTFAGNARKPCADIAAAALEHGIRNTTDQRL